ncbi:MULTISPECIES: OprD family outer membrane porin [unclassified Campylobacter]|uniref:OprD family outer membrane porin n=1 Tax=unclassified Campylobacter TaxID=2593542 RepID=UPI0022E9FF1B|nr:MULTISPECIES: OprD family outer membrane porin [unclassified Campylobacter]MDA3055112.1 major outer membrane protein [Campylobacter sp. VBCF_07 NA4]MDA3061362.1 major outer membrane protein [Campylobacter sp. VBCF_02 NA5]MDA3070881.1 major outer membrane protein [Campylobacter sp. VBCF_08 NA3]WBR54022.1 major outer membrane protein [Campylobacter sp. VBCF_01 NA2]
MKLFKLSLAAALAAGAFATSASAVALEDAIKDVDVSGFAWMRVDSTKNDNKFAGEAGDKADAARRNDHRWRFKSVVNVNTKIDDNFFFVAGIRYAHDGDWAESKTTNADTTKFDLYQGYLGYKIGGTTVQLGRQKIGAFFTDDMYGDGLKVVNQDIEGLTLAALYMDALESDGDIAMNAEVATLAPDGKKLDQHNLWGVAAIGSYDPVSFQLWYASLEDVVDLFAVEAGLSFDVTEDINLGLTAQYAFSDFDGQYTSINGGGAVDDADYFGVEASADLFGFDASVGYVKYDTDAATHSRVSFEDDTSFLGAGEALIGYTDFAGDNWAWYATLGYTIPDTGLRLGVDYVGGEFNGLNGTDTDGWETVVRADYKYNKKLSFKTFWSHAELEKSGADGKDQEQDFIRFQARYAF